MEISSGSLDIESLNDGNGFKFRIRETQETDSLILFYNYKKEPILEFKQNGDVFYKTRLLMSDKEIVDAFIEISNGTKQIMID
jgi:hypothetical protein